MKKPQWNKNALRTDFRRTDGSMPISEVKDLIALEQVRKSMSPVGISHLAQDIAANGVLQNIIKLRLTRRDHVQKYLRFLSKATGERRHIGHLARYRREDGSYEIMIAGHRRREAILQLQGMGSIKLSREDRLLLKELDWSHLKKLKCLTYEPKVDKPDFRRMLAVQLSENLKESPNPLQEAATIATYWWLFAEEEGGPTKEQIASELGRSPDQLRTAIRLFNIPQEARDLIHEGLLPYTAASILGRLVECHVPEDVVVHFAQMIPKEHITLKVLRARVSERIDRWTSTTPDMFGLETHSMEDLRLAQLARIRKETTRQAKTASAFLDECAKFMRAHDPEMLNGVYHDPTVQVVIRNLASLFETVVRLLGKGDQRYMRYITSAKELQRRLPKVAAV